MMTQQIVTRADTHTSCCFAFRLWMWGRRSQSGFRCRQRPAMSSTESRATVLMEAEEGMYVKRICEDRRLESFCFPCMQLNQESPFPCPDVLLFKAPLPVWQKQRTTLI